MSEDKPENQENQETEKEINSFSIESHKKTSCTWVKSGLNAIIRFSPVGGSGFILISSLFNQDWVLSLISFPVTAVTVIWASYSEGFLTKLSEIYAEKGKQDANSVPGKVDKIFQSIKDSFKWQLAGIEDKYLKLQGNTCKDFTTEKTNNNQKNQ